MIRLPKWSLAVGTFALALGLAASALAMQSTKGTIKSMDGDKSQVVVTDENGKDWTYHVQDGAKIYCDKIKDAKLADLKVGSEVRLLWDKKEGKLCVEALIHTDGAYRTARLADGTIKTADDNQLVITDDKSKDWKYQLSDTAKVNVNDKSAKAGDLKSGDHVTIVYQKEGTRYTILDICAKRK
jgi:Cu/Ag efflux protein CusF